MKTHILKILIILTIINSSCNNSSDKSQSGRPCFDNYNMSECLENCKDPERFHYKNYKDNTLELKCGVWLNCVDKEPSIRISSDTLFVDFNIHDSIVAACDCYFNIEFTVKNLKAEPKTIVFENHEIGKYKL